MPQGNIFNRTALIAALGEQESWDIIIIGGGATGLGTALDAASRGFKTLLLEQHDFAKGTSSRSTKLIHGGVRYLAQGDLKLVYSALRERNILAKNAAHIVKRQSFVIPCYSYFDVLKYSSGLKLYDLLAGKYSIGKSKFLSTSEVIKKIPTVSVEGLKGGVEYYDGQFDDSRLAINLAQSAVERSAIVLNYFGVKSLLKVDGKIAGVVAQDAESGREYSLKSKVVINATGVFVDDILRMDEPSLSRLVTPSRGVHLVIKKSYLQSASALMIPKTSDGRVLFAVPWHDHVVIGTTDTPLETNDLEPVATNDDIHFILENLRKYLTVAPGVKDILSVYAGLRPLAATREVTAKAATKELSRDHKLITNKSGLITITGGKWTTYRKMAQDTVDAAIISGALKRVRCQTERIKLHGSGSENHGYLANYGSDAPTITRLQQEHERFNELLIAGHPYRLAEVIWAIRMEMARTIEDVLARRLRLLFLDARAAMTAAAKVAEILKEELKLTDDQVSEQLAEFKKIALHYQPVQ